MGDQKIKLILGHRSRKKKHTAALQQQLETLSLYCVHCTSANTHTVVSHRWKSHTSNGVCCTAAQDICKVVQQTQSELQAHSQISRSPDVPLFSWVTN